MPITLADYRWVMLICRMIRAISTTFAPSLHSARQQVLLLGATAAHYQSLQNSVSSLHLISESLCVGLTGKIVLHHLGFQRHLVSLENLHELEQISADSASLGLMTEMFGNVGRQVAYRPRLHVDAAVCKSAHLPIMRVTSLPVWMWNNWSSWWDLPPHSANLSIVGFGVDEKYGGR